LKKCHNADCPGTKDFDENRQSAHDKDLKIPLSIGYYEELNDSDIKYFIEMQYL
jgi:hypothetical protein